MKSTQIVLLSMVIGLSGCVVVPAHHGYGERHWDHYGYRDRHRERPWYGTHRHWDRGRHHDRDWYWR